MKTRFELNQCLNQRAYLFARKLYVQADQNTQPNPPPLRHIRHRGQPSPIRSQTDFQQRFIRAPEFPCSFHFQFESTLPTESNESLPALSKRLQSMFKATDLPLSKDLDDSLTNPTNFNLLFTEIGFNLNDHHA